MDVERNHEAESQGDSAPPVLHGEALMATCSTNLQREMPGNLRLQCSVTKAGWITLPKQLLIRISDL